MGYLNNKLLRGIILPSVIMLSMAGIAQDKRAATQQIRLAIAKSDSLYARGVSLYKAKRYREAIPLFTGSDKIDKVLYDQQSPRREYAEIWLASCYYQLGDTTKAKATNQYYKIPPVDRRQTIKNDSLAKLALDWFNKGDYKKALDNGLLCARLEKNMFGSNHYRYADILAFLVSCNVALGNYTETISLGKKSASIIEQTLGTENRNYANSLNSLAMSYAMQGNYEEAIKQGTKAADIMGRVLGKDHTDYATTLNNLSRCYAFLGNYGEAIKLGIEALKIRDKATEVLPTDLSNSLVTLAGYCHIIGADSMAIEFETVALEIKEKVLGKNHPNYAVSLNNLALYSYHVNNLPALTAYSTEATFLYTNMIRKTFSDLTTYERNMFWIKYEDWYLACVPEFAYKYPMDSLVINAYNGTLLSKGLLLNSEMEMNRLLYESGDKEALKAYTELQQTRQMLNRLYEKPIAERKMNTDSLERVVNRMERALVQRSKAYGDYTRNLAITWEDVQQRLSKKDVAVEFVSFPHAEDSTMYVAYVLTADMPVPQMVSLFEARQLSAVPHSQYYTTPDLSKLIWEKLDQYVAEADNVYFAPTGELYNIAIESLPDYNGNGLVSDRCSFYRLSSTRELAIARNKEEIRNAVLYGGLRYDTDTKQMEADSRNYRRVRSQEIDTYHVADSLNLRGDIKYLPATKTETEYITASLQRAAIHSQLFTENNGTEASFKDLSGKNTNILHLATHGFYWSEREAQRRDYLNFLMQEGNQPSRQVEDKAMVRSGLMLSGANNALRGKKLPEHVEDGILTAKEISSLDLRGLDLVVLSACQTGLGEITGDGVFGLQRGFKKAGANTLMMSLWKVDDNATQLLMKRFYDNLLFNTNPRTGKIFTKFEALKDAQRYVREYEETINGSSTGRKPYEDPECWAAFVLLDAVN